MPDPGSPSLIKSAPGACRRQKSAGLSAPANRHAMPTIAIGSTTPVIYTMSPSTAYYPRLHAPSLPCSSDEPVASKQPPIWLKRALSEQAAMSDIAFRLADLLSGRALQASPRDDPTIRISTSSDM